MWPRLCFVLLAACYAPRAAPGTPCTPELANCPGEQTCALVQGEYVCVETPFGDGGHGDDASVDGPPEAGAVTPWTLVQTRGVQGTNEKLDLDIDATGAGNLIIVGVETNGMAVTAMSDDRGNTYLPVPDSRSRNAAEVFGVELWYAKSSIASTRKLTVTAPIVYGVVVWEVAGMHPTDPLTAASFLDDQPASTSPAGAPITTTTTGEFVVSIAIVENVVSGIAAGNAFTNDHTVFGNGWAHLTDAGAPVATYVARWTQPNIGVSCASSAAFRRAD